MSVNHWKVKTKIENSLNSNSATLFFHHKLNLQGNQHPQKHRWGQVWSLPHPHPKYPLFFECFLMLLQSALSRPYLCHSWLQYKTTDPVSTYHSACVGFISCFMQGQEPASFSDFMLLPVRQHLAWHLNMMSLVNNPFIIKDMMWKKETKFCKLVTQMVMLC